MTTANSAASEPHNNRSIAKYLGPAPLIDGEVHEAYQRILEQITATVMPKDPFEEIWVRDIADMVWEGLRWRRYAAAFITELMRANMLDTLRPVLQDPGRAMQLSNGYSLGKPDAKTLIKQVFEKIGSSMDAVAVNALATRSSNIEWLDFFQRFAAQADARRNAALNELSKHKAFAELLRKASELIIQDAEFQEIASAQGDKMSSLTNGNGARGNRETEDQDEDAEEQVGG